MDAARVTAFSEPDEIRTQFLDAIRGQDYCDTWLKWCECVALSSAFMIFMVRTPLKQHPFILTQLLVESRKKIQIQQWLQVMGIQMQVNYNASPSMNTDITSILIVLVYEYTSILWS